MENKDVWIIILAILVIYLAYQQTQSKTLPIQPNNQEFQELKNQANHYQTLYQKRVKKDIEADQSEKIKQLTFSNQQLAEEFNNYKTVAENKITELISESQQKQEILTKKITDLENQVLNIAKQKLTDKKEFQELMKQLESNLNSEKEKSNLYQQKVNDQNTALINLARQKIKGKKEAEKLLSELEKNWNQDKKAWKDTETSYLKKVEELTSNQQQKELTIVNLNNFYDKLAEKKNQAEQEWNREKEQLIKQKNQEKEQQQQEFQEQLRKINILFDDNTANYETIDFSGLYSLLETVAERERERESRIREFTNLQQEKEKKEQEITELKATHQKELNQREEELEKWKATQQTKLDRVSKHIKNIGSIYQQNPKNLSELYNLLKKTKRQDDEIESELSAWKRLAKYDPNDQHYEIEVTYWLSGVVSSISSTNVPGFITDVGDLEVWGKLKDGKEIKVRQLPIDKNEIKKGMEISFSARDAEIEENVLTGLFYNVKKE